MLSLIIALIVSIVVTGFGNKLLKLTKFNFSSIYEEVSYSGGLGFGVFGNSGSSITSSVVEPPRWRIFIILSLSLGGAIIYGLSAI